MAVTDISALLINNLRVGSVIYTHCAFCTPPKNKYLLVVSLEPNLLVLVINSQIHQFFHTNNTAQYHVTIPKTDHNFLRHDSYANCIDAQTAFKLEDCRQQMVENYNDFHKGWVTDDCLEKVLNAVSTQKIMRKAHKEEIIASLNSRLNCDAQAS